MKSLTIYQTEIVKFKVKMKPEKYGTNRNLFVNLLVSIILIDKYNNNQTRFHIITVQGK